VYAVRCGANFYLGVDHGNGWKSTYYHLANQQAGLIGKSVSAGTYLGDADRQTPCGGSASFNHVHLTVTADGKPVAVSGFRFGGYTAYSSGSDYYGYWTNSAGAKVLTNNGLAGCCLVSSTASNSSQIADPVIAFQANTGSLWSATGDLRLGMMPGTSPAMARLPGGGYQIAFQANTGSLWTTGSLGTRDLGLGMRSGTSPSIAAVAGGYQIAFQANTGSLWTTGSLGTRDLGLGMRSGTSPSIAAVAGGYQIAFQANTGSLWTVGSLGTGDLKLGMLAGTSPSIAAVAGGYQIAFQANTGSLWTVGSLGTRNLGLGLRAATSPSIG
jgi:hypothetical protein